MSARKITKPKTRTASSGNSKRTKRVVTKRPRRSATKPLARSRTTPRAVPVATALQSLVPAKPLVTPIAAATMHAPVIRPGLTPAVRRPVPVVPPELIETRRHVYSRFGLVAAVVIVITGWVATSHTVTRNPGGRILGLSASQPLRVTVNVSGPAQNATIGLPVANGTMAEALARASTALHGTMSYTSRGGSIYLTTFAGQTDTPTGHWVVTLNGQPVSDLSQPVLQQDDAIAVSWQ